MSPAIRLLDTVLREASDKCEDGCLRGWQIGFAAILFVEAIVFAHLPFVVKRFSPSSVFTKVQIYGTAMSAGIFLATGMLHVLPEAVFLLNPEEEAHSDHGGEADGDAALEGDGEEDHDHDDHDDHDHDEARRNFLTVLSREDDDHGHGEEEDAHNHGGFPWAFFSAMAAFYVFLLIERVIVPRIPVKSKDATVSSAEEEEAMAVDDAERELNEEKDAVKYGFRSAAFLAAFFEVVGLMAHSVFESIALGLSSSFSTALSIFVATAAHRWATVSALSFKLYKKLNYPALMVQMVIFALAVPLGVGIGLGLSGLEDDVRGVLFGISAGTFLYVGAYEGVAETFGSSNFWLVRKYIAMVAGAAIMSVITAILVATGMHG